MHDDVIFIARIVTTLFFVLFLWYFARVIKKMLWVFNAFVGLLVVTVSIFGLKYVWVFVGAIETNTTMTDFISQTLQVWQFIPLYEMISNKTSGL